MQDLQATIDMILDYARGVWIKKRYIMIMSWVICPLGLFYVAKMPDIYESKTRVYADTRSMLKPLLRGLTIQNNSDLEVQLIAKTLMSKENLEAIAREADLDINTNNKEQFNSLISSLKGRIKFSTAGRENFYTVQFSDRSPEVAQKVVSATLNKFVESSLGQNRKDSDTASKFIEQQIAEYADRLQQAEQKVAEFKKQYGDLTSGAGYYQEVKGLKGRIEDISLQISEKESQLNNLREKFSTTTSAASADTVNVETQYDDRIKTLQAQLDDLQIRFTEQHPDVLQTREKLNHLKGLRETEIDSMVASLAQGKVTSGGLSENAIVQDLTMVMNNLEGEVASLNVRRSNFQEKLESLEQKLDLIPDIEAKRVALNRDYGITKRKFEELLNRKESADLSRKADLSSEEVKFRVIEPPSLPRTPTGPPRIIFYTIVTLLSFAAGTAIAFLVSQLRPVVVSSRSITDLTGRPVLGSVSDINIEHIKKKNRAKVIGFAISNAGIFVLFLLFLGTEVAMKTTPIELISRFL